MNTKLREKAFDLTLFLINSIGIIVILPNIYRGKFDWFDAFLQLFVVLYFLKKKSPLMDYIYYLPQLRGSDTVCKHYKPNYVKL